MKGIYKLLLPASMFVLALVSCKKYLDVQPKGVQLLTSVSDYEKWLNNSSLGQSIPRELNLLADNVDNPTLPISLTDVNDRIYTWQAQFVLDDLAPSIIWSKYYSSIYYYNAVIRNIDKVDGGTAQQKSSLKAEALLGRAFEYLSLVNLYGKAYDPKSASQDLAVPFVTSIDITDPTPPRSSVQQIYDHIIADVNTAIADLPRDNSANRFRGSVAAAYGVLARTYLYMGDYVKAEQNAQLALNNGPNAIFDFTKIPDASSIPGLIKRPDAIYARIADNYNIDEIPTLAFLKSFDTKDLRLNFFYVNLGDYSFTTRGEVHYQPPYGGGGISGFPNWGISVAEMRLIIAESAARRKDVAIALNQLDLVRKTRFAAADYVTFQSSNEEAVLQKVLDERTFEFAYTGLRWFDMRRLDAQGRMTTVNRYDDSGSATATLSPGSDKYVLQIPKQVLYFNPAWQQNPR